MMMRQKKYLAVLTVILTAALLICMLAVVTSAQEGEQRPEEKRVSLEYTGEPVDITAFFEPTQGAEYSCVNSSGEGTLDDESLLLTVTKPGAFRVVQRVGSDEVWVTLFVCRTLTVTVKDQVLPVGQLPSSGVNDVTVEGLFEGHTVSAVTLIADTGSVFGAHDVIKAIAVTVMDGEEDVSTCYNLQSVNGSLHSYSVEWAKNEAQHFYVCSAFDCELMINVGGHDFKAACDAVCDICLAQREVVDHVWSSALTITEPTEESVGERIYMCIHCETVRSEVIPLVERMPVAAIVAIVVACAAVLGTVAYFTVRALTRKPEGEQERETEEQAD